MEMTHSFLAGLRTPVGTVGNPAETGALDWPGLHARLCAAHAARRVMVCGDSQRVSRGGAFHEWKEAVRPAATSSGRVNLTDLTDGKAACSTAAGVAGHSKVGD